MVEAEIHWFEAAGIGRVEDKAIRDLERRKLNYVKCIDNEGYEGSLTKGKVYRVLTSEPSLSPTMIRIIDETYGELGSEMGYLFAASRFEPVDPNQIHGEADDSLTIHLPAALKGILYAEAIVAQKSMSALARKWIEEHLDLP